MRMMTTETESEMGTCTLTLGRGRSRRGGTGRGRRWPELRWGDWFRGTPGGYARILLGSLVLAWYLRDQRLIGPGELRLIFAVLELRETRCTRSHRGWFTAEDLVARFGGELARVRAGLDRLLELGYLQEFGREIRLAGCVEQLRVEEPVRREGEQFLAGFAPEGVARIVPLPRRWLRELARRSTTPAQIAVVIAHAIRCLFWGSPGIRGKGCLKAGWVASTFRLSGSTVQRWRAWMIEAGWLVPLETCQQVRNAVGQWFTVPLGEDRAIGGRESCTPIAKIGGPLAARDREIGAPLKTRDPSLRSEERAENQKPDRVRVPQGDRGQRQGRGAGGLLHAARDRGGRNRDRQPDSPDPSRSRPRSTAPRWPDRAAGPGRPPGGGPRTRPAAGRGRSPVSWDRMTGANLADPEQLGALFEQAVARGVLPGSQADRLRFFAAAQRARGRADRNACGFFRRLVEGQHWDFLTQAEEDRAREQLSWLRDRPARSGSSSADPRPGPVSDSGDQGPDSPGLTPVAELIQAYARELSVAEQDRRERERALDRQVLERLRRSLQGALRITLDWAAVWRLMTEGWSSLGRDPESLGGPHAHRLRKLVAEGWPEDWSPVRFATAVGVAERELTLTGQAEGGSP